MDLSLHNNTNSYLTFKIGTELFGASVKFVISILEMTKITRVPQAPEYMKGVINLRGSVLPVIDTRVKFGITDTKVNTNTCILVLELIIKNEALRLGAIVDSVQEVLELSEDDIQPPPQIGSKYQANIIKGMAVRNNQFIMILDINKLFIEESIVDINNVSL